LKINKKKPTLLLSGSDPALITAPTTVDQRVTLENRVITHIGMGMAANQAAHLARPHIGPSKSNQQHTAAQHIALFVYGPNGG
jgi:hypothetical protein